MPRFDLLFRRFASHRTKFVLFVGLAAIAGWFGKDGTVRKPRLVSITDAEVQQGASFDETMRENGWCIVENTNPDCIPYADDPAYQRKSAVYASRPLAPKATRTRKAESRTIGQAR
jgi:hypothetical protein